MTKGSYNVRCSNRRNWIPTVYVGTVLSKQLFHESKSILIWKAYCKKKKKKDFFFNYFPYFKIRKLRLWKFEWAIQGPKATGWPRKPDLLDSRFCGFLFPWAIKVQFSSATVAKIKRWGVEFKMKESKATLQITVKGSTGVLKVI